MSNKKISQIVSNVKKIIGKKSKNLHEPLFDGKEFKYLKNCITTSFVSSVGEYVNLFEKKLKQITKTKYAIAIINGTSALHLILRCIGVTKNDEVLVPSLTFVATANAVVYCDAQPHFIDVERDNFGICPKKLEEYLKKIVIKKNTYSINKKTGKKIKALIAVHVFGMPCKILEINKICKKYNIKVVEDAAEALGSYFNKKHLGTFSLAGMISFNGNKTITSGNGAIVLTNNMQLAKKIKHYSTTAKKTHKWEYDHDSIGYNYRLSNINAAVGCAQIENLKKILISKKRNFLKYSKIFKDLKDIEIKCEPSNSSSNYWLISLIIKNKNIKKNNLLNSFHKSKIKCRPVWKPLHQLKMFRKCQQDNCSNSIKVYSNTINLPSSPELSY
tara:strand:+ start:475 stop:1635 length:1161 start_codon:yes stop_codon:yes gene_type:complete